KLLATHAGPISKNCKSSKKDGFLPSILWPTNCPIQATTKIAAQTLKPHGSSVITDKQMRINMPIDKNIGVDKRILNIKNMTIINKVKQTVRELIITQILTKLICTQ